MCEHLIELDNELKRLGICEISRGMMTWTEHCREWVYYDCYLDTESLRKRFDFPDFITVHTNDDERSGLEEGFFCERCEDGVMGLHRGFIKYYDPPKVTVR